MSLGSNLEGSAFLLKQSANQTASFLSSEVYGGRWSDDVGSSYIPYTQTLNQAAEKFADGAQGAVRIENSLHSINEASDKNQLEKLKAAVNGL